MAHAIVKKHSETIGLPPGSLVYIGDKPDKEVKITIVNYNDQDYTRNYQHPFRECLYLCQGNLPCHLDRRQRHQNVKDLEYLGNASTCTPWCWKTS